MTKTAVKFLAELKANIDAWYADEIDHATFSERQRVIWDAIGAAGPDVDEEVARVLRRRLPPLRLPQSGAA